MPTGVGGSQNNKGITLIALIITIIVMLILAGVTINIAINGGLFGQAQKAVDQTSLDQFREEVIIHVSEKAMQIYAEERTPTPQEIANYLESIYGLGNVTYVSGMSGIQVIKGNKVAVVNVNNYTVTAKIADGTENSGENGWSVEVVATTVEGVPIPVGFYYVGGTKDTGIVISDNAADENKGDSHAMSKTLLGNQFVWIPANDDDLVGGFTKRQFLDANCILENYPDPDTQEYSDLNASAIKYKGFYIARYEASYTTANGEKMASKPSLNASTQSAIAQEGQLMNFITQTVAVTMASDMYQASNSVVSHLIYGKEWDTALAWVGKEDIQMVITGGSSWGNYYDAEVTGITGYYDLNNSGIWTPASTKPAYTSGLLNTGDTEYTRRKNVYNLAGNLGEWTQEIYSTSHRVIRGGYFYGGGSNDPPVGRDDGDPSGSGGGVGARVALYIK